MKEMGFGKYSQYNVPVSWGSMRKLFFMLGMALLLVACSEAEVVEHVEAFTIETMSDTPNSSGLYVKTGYKRENSVVLFKEWNSKLHAEVSSITDFYDLNGNYVNTIVSYTFSKELKLHNTIDSRKEQVELMEPTTILAPDISVVMGETKNLTDEEKERVRARVFKYVDEFK